jgi:hypothetical protein
MLKRLMGQFFAETADPCTLYPDEIASSKICFIQGDFPSQVNVQPAPAVEGDWASTNPRTMYLSGPGGLVCGNAGVIIGRFAWVTDQFLDGDNAPAVVNSFAGNAMGVTTSSAVQLPVGVVPRVQQGLIQTYLTSSGMTIAAGYMVSIMSSGDIWMRNAGTTNALVGQAAYANFADGRALFGAYGTVGVSSIGGATMTGSIGPASVTVTGSITGNVLTTSGTASGWIAVGSFLSGGTGITSGTQIVAQLSGVSGSAGGATYALSIPQQSIGAALFTLSYGVFTVATVVSGTVGVGDIISSSGGTSLTAGTMVTQLGTGAGGVGTYYVQFSQTAGTETITVQTNVMTKFVAASSGKPGELIKITSAAKGN